MTSPPDPQLDTKALNSAAKGAGVVSLVFVAVWFLHTEVGRIGEKMTDLALSVHDLTRDLTRIKGMQEQVVTEQELRHWLDVTRLRNPELDLPDLP